MTDPPGNFHTIEDGPWPYGTTVAVWSVNDVVGGVPVGAEIDNGVAGPDGTVTFGGLSIGEQYTAFGHGGSMTFFCTPSGNQAIEDLATQVSRFGVNVEGEPYNASPSASAAENVAAITSAIAAAALLGTHVLFPTKGAVYPVNAEIQNPQGVPMTGEDWTLDGSARAAGLTLSSVFALRVSGTRGAMVNPTGALSAASAVLAIPTAGLAAGDELLIESTTQLYMDGVSGTEKRMEIRRVKTIDSGTQATLTEPLRFAYDSGSTTRVTKLNLIEPRIEGLHVKMGGTGKVHSGVLFEYCREPVVKRAKVDGCEDTGLQFSYCYGGDVSGSRISDATSPTPVGTTGYGIVGVDASRDVHISRNRIRNCRHGVAAGSCAVDWRVFDNDLENCGVNSGNSLDCHEPNFGWCFDFNRITGALNGGIGIRGQDCKARWNVMRDVASHGVIVKSFDTNPAGSNNTEVIGNDIERSGGAGIRFEGTAVCRIKGGQVYGNRLKSNVDANLTLILTDDLEVGANIYDTPSGSGNDGNNVRLVGTSSSDRCERITIRGGISKGAPLRWLKADFAEELVVDSPFIVNHANNTILTSCTNTQVTDQRGPAAPPLRQVNATNANFTLSPLVSAPTVIQTASVSSTDKTCTLATTNLHEALEFLIVRQDAGGFNLLVLNGSAGPTIYTLPAHGWVRVGRDATNANWIVLSAGVGV